MSDVRSIDRYHRQMLLPGFGAEGQEHLRRARVTIIGCGALGTHSADLLVRAGVGDVTLVDRDLVEWTNLQRQSLFDESDAQAGRPKAAAAADRLRRVNSQAEIRAVIADVTRRNVEGLCEGRSLVLDGTDNFQTRYLINDVCVKGRVPWIYAGCVAARGIGAVMWPDRGLPCLRCLAPEPPGPEHVETCDTTGVFAPSAAIVAAWQAGEAIKILLGEDQCLSRSMLSFDLWSNRRLCVTLDSARDPDCPCCGEARFDFLEGSAGREDVASLCGRDAVQVSPARCGTVDGALSLDALAERLGVHASVTRNEYFVRAAIPTAAASGGDERRFEITVFRDGRAIVRGVSDVSQARAIYARFIGM